MFEVDERDGCRVRGGEWVKPISQMGARRRARRIHMLRWLTRVLEIESMNILFSEGRGEVEMTTPSTEGDLRCPFPNHRGCARRLT